MRGKRGFMPFSAAGAVVVMLVLAMVGHAAWSRHQRALGTVDEIAGQTLLTAAASVQADLRRLARYAVYNALWDVGKRAGNYESGAARELAIERLAAGYFAELASGLLSTYEQHDPRIELKLPNAWPRFDLQQTSGGYAIAAVELPAQTRIKVSSWDNKFRLILLYENFSVFVDSRYFLLQERGDRFIEGIPGLDGVGSTWWAAEYATAWSQALAGRVQLSERRSRAFFELAWARHEYDTFGSSDYLATSARLLEVGGDTVSTLDFGSSAAEIALPVSAAEVETMKNYIDDCIGSLDEAGSELRKVKEYVERAMSHARENLENLVRRELNAAIESVWMARACVRGVSQGFEGLLGYLMVKGNELSDQLYRGLTEPGGAYPALGQQISVGVEGVGDKLAALESSVSTCLKRVGDNSAPLENLLTEFEVEVEALVQATLATSAPNRLSVEEYPGPESYVHDPGSEPKLALREIGVYTIDGPNAGLGTLRAVLVNAKSDFERMRSLAEIADEARERLGEVDIGEGLKRKLLYGTGFCPEDPQSRERAYEILPPAPIDAKPGISVFHDFRVTDVRYERRDPLGRLDEAAPPTPIPLWFIGLTLYWAQWGVSLEVGDGAVEEIFDFDNPVLLREHSLPSGVVIVHKPLAYRYEMPGRRFSFALVIVLPWRNFTISRPEMMP